MRTSRIATYGYLLGIVSLLAAAIYFFASNWAGLSHPVKLGLGVALPLVFYSIAAICASRNWNLFLSNLFLVAGCVSFGASIAVIGQTYNSHADSYMLFLLWSIPALLFGLVKRSEPFFVIAYALIHATALAAFRPSSIWIQRTDFQETLFYLALGLFNVLLFILLERYRWPIRILAFVSFAVAQVNFLVLADSHARDYGVWFNVLPIVTLSFAIWYFLRRRFDQSLLLLTSLFVSIFAIVKFIEIVRYFDKSLTFIVGLVFVALLLWANTRWIRYVGRLQPNVIEEEQDSKPEHQNQTKVQGSAFSRIITYIVIAVGVGIGVISLVGLLSLLRIQGIQQVDIAYGLGSIMIVASLFISRELRSVRYTVFLIGTLLGIGSAAIGNITGLYGMVVLFSLFVIQLAVAQHPMLRLFIYVLVNIMASIITFKIMGSSLHENLFWTAITVANLMIYIFTRLREMPARWQGLQTNSYLVFLLALYIGTFQTKGYFLTAFHIAFLVIAIGSVFYFARRGERLLSAYSFALWVIFIVVKYYDLYWKLLHKSVTLALIGLILLAISYVVERRSQRLKRPNNPTVHRYRIVWLASIVLLQLVICSLQIGKSEQLLANGDVVKLELQPIDPRSMLQGDYLSLQYKISFPYRTDIEDPDRQPRSGKVSVVIEQAGNGLYQFSRLAKPGDILQANERLITGRWNGYDQIYYGIETYYVEEGKGIALQEKVKYAEVRLSRSGDALLVKLMENL